MKNKLFIISLVQVAGLILTSCKVLDYPVFPPIAFIGNSGETSDLYVVWDMNGENYEGPINLSKSPGTESSPSWSHARNWVVYASEYDGQSDIFLVDVAKHIMGEGNTINLTNGEGYNSAPSWSPDGYKIAFASTRGIDSGVFIMNEDGSNPEFLAPGHAAKNIQWSKDGSRIAYESGDDLYIINSDGSELECVNENFASIENLSWPVVIDFSMSSNGEVIAFSFEDIKEDELIYNIVVVENDGREVIMWLKEGNTKYLYPDISPNGKRLAFTQTPDTLCVMGIGEFSSDFPKKCYVVEVDNAAPVRPQWSVEGDYIGYLVYHPEHAGLNLRVLSVDKTYFTDVIDNWIVDDVYGEIEWAPRPEPMLY